MEGIPMNGNYLKQKIKCHVSLKCCGYPHPMSTTSRPVHLYQRPMSVQQKFQTCGLASQVTLGHSLGHFNESRPHTLMHFSQRRFSPSYRTAFLVVSLKDLVFSFLKIGGGTKLNLVDVRLLWSPLFSDIMGSTWRPRKAVPLRDAHSGCTFAYLSVRGLSTDSLNPAKYHKFDVFPFT